MAAPTTPVTAEVLRRELSCRRESMVAPPPLVTDAVLCRELTGRQPADHRRPSRLAARRERRELRRTARRARGGWVGGLMNRLARTALALRRVELAPDPLDGTGHPELDEPAPTPSSPLRVEDGPAPPALSVVAQPIAAHAPPARPLPTLTASEVVAA